MTEVGQQLTAPAGAVAVSTQLTTSRSYTTTEMAAEFRQGEILTGVTENRYDSEADELTPNVHPYAIILTPDCDLLRVHESRAAGKPMPMPNFLIYAAKQAEDARGDVAGSDVWRRVKNNADERYQFLQAGLPLEDLEGVGLPPLVVDFRNFFCIAPAELYAQVQSSGAARRCRLEAVYREHMQARAGAYFQRVGLPEPHSA